MNRLFNLPNNCTIGRMLLFLILLGCCFIACNKQDHFPFPGNNDASKYSSDVIDKWITMQIRLERDATGIPNVAFVRYYAYSGIAAFEALAPGNALGMAVDPKWNGLTNLPQSDVFKTYYLPASVNTSLAEMN